MTHLIKTPTTYGEKPVAGVWRASHREEAAPNTDLATERGTGTKCWCPHRDTPRQDLISFTSTGEGSV